MNKNRNRAWYFGAAVAAIAAIVLGWFLGIQPQLAAATASDAQRIAVLADNNQKEAALAELKKQYEGIDDLRAQLEELRESLPADADINGFLLQVAALNKKHGVSLTNISFTEGANYTSVDPLPRDPAIPPPPVAEPTDEPTPAPTATATPDPSATATATPDPAVTSTPTPGATSTPAAGDGTAAAGDDPEQNADVADGAEVTLPYEHRTRPDPRVNPGNFITIDVALQFTTTQAAYRAYIHDLQYGARVFLLTDIRITRELPAPNAKKDAPQLYKVDLTGTMYVLRV
jgi:hypothetical protein